MVGKAEMAAAALVLAMKWRRDKRRSSIEPKYSEVISEFYMEKNAVLLTNLQLFVVVAQALGEDPRNIAVDHDRCLCGQLNVIFLKHQGNGI